MANTEKKVVIDNNWYISFLIKKDDSQLNVVLSDYNIELIISDDLVNELKNTIKRKKFRKYFSIEYANSFIERLLQAASLISVTTPLQNWCRDIKDNYLLALSKDSNANYLVTGDGDLLTLEKFENTKIVSLPEFIEITNQQSQ